MLSACSTLLLFTHPLWSQTTRCVNVISAIYIEASVHKLIAHFDMNIHPLRINHKESRKMDIKGTKRGRVNIIDTESNIKTKMEYLILISIMNNIQ